MSTQHQIYGRESSINNEVRWRVFYRPVIEHIKTRITLYTYNIFRINSLKIGNHITVNGLSHTNRTILFTPS